MDQPVLSKKTQRLKAVVWFTTMCAPFSYLRRQNSNFQLTPETKVGINANIHCRAGHLQVPLPSDYNHLHYRGIQLQIRLVGLLRGRYERYNVLYSRKNVLF